MLFSSCKTYPTLRPSKNWIVVNIFSSNSYQVSSFMSQSFFFLLYSAFFNSLWVKMAFILICHCWNWWHHWTLNIELERIHLQVYLSLILIVVKFDSPTTCLTRAAQWKQPHNLWGQREEVKKKIFLMYRKPTNNIYSSTDQTDPVYIYRRRGEKLY